LDFFGGQMAQTAFAIPAAARPTRGTKVARGASQVEYSLGGCRLYADHSLQEEQQNMKTSLRAVARVLPYFALALALIFVASFARVQAADDQPMPTVGSMAPDFTLNSQENTPVSLHDFKGKWVVLYFYPKDQTPGCTIEAHGFTRDQDQYVKKNAVVLGVSVDTVDSHKEFCAKDGINFKLLSDTSMDVVSKYGSLNQMNGTSRAARNTFLIDPTGKIVKVYVKVNPTPHSEEVLAALDELQKGGGQ
jgi:peroxiredoxin Q/BCP